jgi:hypothetical protein
MEKAEYWETFRMDALKDAKLEGHPKADEFYALAWKHGHEGGPYEVMAHLRDIAKMNLEVANDESKTKTT